MLRQNAVVDRGQGILSWKTQCKHREVTLQTRIDGETTRGGVHTTDVLGVVNILETELDTVVPMTVIQVLPDQSMGLYCEVLINLKGRDNHYNYFHLRKVHQLFQFI